MASTDGGNGHYKVIGTRPIRHDGTDKVTGRAIYGGDVRLPGMLYGQVLRSPYAHARIRGIDTGKAEALEGVRAIVTGRDLPLTDADEIIDLGEGATKLKYLRDNVLATDKVLYKGHAVAAVAATSPHIADEALDLIEVDYEVLPAVVNVLDAMKDDAPLLHEGQTTQADGEDTGKVSNVAIHVQHVLGDPEAGFAEADIVVEREYDTATVHQGYIEPHNATATWKADGQLTIWTSTQGAFTVQKTAAAVLGHPISKTRVVPQEIGGGFGGKIPVYLEPPAALLSRKTGQPVKLIMTRADVFEGTGPTPGSRVRVKMGADKTGRLTSAEAYMAFEAGAYPGSPMPCGVMCVFACYDIPNGRIDGYDVVVNKPRSFAYRAPCSTQVALATETVMEEIAEKLGINSVELRLMNVAKEGTRRVDGVVYPRIGTEETLKQLKAHDHYGAPLVGPNQGRGVSIGYWFNVGFKSSVTASVNTDGTVELVEGSTDIGGTRTSVAMQFAEVLGLAAEDINPQVADTSSVGYTDVTGGSRVTYATGWAAIEAAKDVKAKMIERAAMLWEVASHEVTFEDGVFQHKGNATKPLTFKELAARLDETGGAVTGQGSVDPGMNVGGSFAANIADVEVDPETGKVQILRYTVLQDAGKAIHPSYVEGQMQGGTVQGIGWALNEEYFYNEKGEMANPTLLDYRIPTALDLPMIDTVIVEVPDPLHPFGVRGVGEANIVPPPAAIANAIYDAVGIKLGALPMRPDRVVAALQKKGKAEPALVN